MATPQELFARLGDRFAGEPGVTEGTGFGSMPGLRVQGKIFVMLVDDELVLKLPAARCAELAEAGRGRPLQVGTRSMREWVVLAGADEEEWTALADEALAFVRPRGRG